MKYIKKFNESKGIPDITIEYSDILLNKIKNVIDKSTDPIEYITELQNNDLPPIDKKFPVSKIKLEFKIIHSEDEDGPFFTTGFCYNLIEEDGSRILSDGSMFLRISAQLEICPSFESNDLPNALNEIESTLMHELNHAYEGYMRYKNRAPQIKDALTVALDSNTENVSEEVWNIWWKELGYYLYWTESHEMNAIVQETLPFVKKGIGSHELKDKVKVWRKLDDIINFDAKEFKNRLVLAIQNTMEGDPEEILTNMKNGLSEEIKKVSKEKGEGDSSVSYEKIKNLNIDEFLSYCQNRLNRRGEILRRRILRNYSR